MVIRTVKLRNSDGISTLPNFALISNLPITINDRGKVMETAEPLLGFLLLMAFGVSLVISQITMKVFWIAP
ncbi:MAG: hypothetical protein CMM47_05985 [Rhodospirillaceae bacterium]|nr:hypothetical protein [Rhodospirillaceae bacterium]